MGLAVECVDCLRDGVTNWRPIKSGATKRSWRCATHTRALRLGARVRARAGRLGVKFGIDMVRYNSIKAVQGGTCAICGPWSGRNGNSKALAVDHDHGCTRGHAPDIGCDACVRGLLCSDCNRMLGRLGDNPAVFKRAIAYLAHPPAQDVEGWHAATQRQYP